MFWAGWTQTGTAKVSPGARSGRGSGSAPREKGAAVADSMVTDSSTTDTGEVFWSDTVAATTGPPIGWTPKFTEEGVALIGAFPTTP